MADIAHGSMPGLPGNDSLTFHGIFVVSFAVFLLLALGAALLTPRWRLWLPGAEGEKSLIHGVNSAVYTFMSYLT